MSDDRGQQVLVSANSDSLAPPATPSIGMPNNDKSPSASMREKQKTNKGKKDRRPQSNPSKKSEESEAGTEIVESLDLHSCQLTADIPHAPDLITFNDFVTLYELAKVQYYSVTTLTKVGTKQEQTYGEALPELVSVLARQLDIKPSDVFLDIGSGIGNVVMQIAAEFGCTAIGIEVRAELVEIANAMHKLISEAVQSKGKKMGEVTFIHGDATDESLMFSILPRTTIIFMNNYCYPPSMQGALEQLFHAALQNNTRILAIKNLFPRGKKDPERWEGLEKLIVHPWKKYEIGNGGVSWSDMKTSWLLYTIDRNQEARLDYTFPFFKRIAGSCTTWQDSDDALLRAYNTLLSTQQPIALIPNPPLPLSRNLDGQAKLFDFISQREVAETILPFNHMYTADVVLPNIRKRLDGSQHNVEKSDAMEMD